MNPLGVLGEVEVAFSVWSPERGGWTFEVSYLESTKGGGEWDFHNKGSGRDQCP